MTVREAIELDLAGWEKRRPGVSRSGLAALALELADQIDKPSNSATSKSMCANSLDKVLERIEASLPPADEKDGLDELKARRAKRRASSG